MFLIQKAKNSLQRKLRHTQTGREKTRAGRVSVREKRRKAKRRISLSKLRVFRKNNEQKQARTERKQVNLDTKRAKYPVFLERLGGTLSLRVNFEGRPIMIIIQDESIFKWYDAFKKIWKLETGVALERKEREQVL